MSEQSYDDFDAAFADDYDDIDKCLNEKQGKKDMNQSKGTKSGERWVEQSNSNKQVHKHGLENNTRYQYKITITSEEDQNKPDQTGPVHTFETTRDRDLLKLRDLSNLETYTGNKGTTQRNLSVMDQNLLKSREAWNESSQQIREEQDDSYLNSDLIDITLNNKASRNQGQNIKPNLTDNQLRTPLIDKETPFKSESTRYTTDLEKLPKISSKLAPNIINFDQWQAAMGSKFKVPTSKTPITQTAKKENEYRSRNQSLLQNHYQTNTQVKNLDMSMVTVDQRVNQTFDYGTNQVKSMRKQSRAQLAPVIESKFIEGQPQTQRPHRKLKGLSLAQNDVTPEKKRHIFERPAMTPNLIKLQDHNLDLKKQLSGIISQLETKLQSSKEKTKKMLQEHNDETYQQIKDNELKLRKQAQQEKLLRKQILEQKNLLGMIYTNNKVLDLENDLTNKQNILRDLKRNREYFDKQNQKETQIFQIQQELSEQKGFSKSKIKDKLRDLTIQVRTYKKRQRILGQELREQHTMILERDDKCKKLMSFISDRKANPGIIVNTDKLKSLKSTVETSKSELRELKQRKRTKEREFVSQMQQLDGQIDQQVNELKVLRLRLKDKGYEVSLMEIRRKEIEKQIEEYQRLRRQHFKQEMQLMMKAQDEEDRNMEQGQDDSYEKSIKESDKDLFSMTQMQDDASVLAQQLNQDDEMKEQLKERRNQQLAKDTGQGKSQVYTYQSQQVRQATFMNVSGPIRKEDSPKQEMENTSIQVQDSKEQNVGGVFKKPAFMMKKKF